jgi:metal-responsive CopG/Arc/MetJ family transcriptional regulator
MNQLTRCDRLIQIRAPEFLTKALDSAADKRLTSRSDYIRVALGTGPLCRCPDE